MVKVAVLDDYQGVAKSLADWSVLPPEVEVQVFHDHLFDEDAVVKRLRDFDIVSGMRERTPFPRSLLERLPNLKLLITTSMDNRAWDMEDAADLGIVVEGTHNRGAMGGGRSGLLNLTWGLVLALTTNLVVEDRAVRKGRWQTGLATNVSGKTLGLVGLGGLGSQMAEVGRFWGMRVIAWSQNLTEERATECEAIKVTKEELFSRSDVITVNYALSERSRGIVGARDIALMKPTAYLVNTSRGPLVDEAALVDALQRRTIAGAGIDTFDQEPLPLDHPFRHLDNVIITPHIGYVTNEVYRVWFPDIVSNIQLFLKGEYARVLNPSVFESPNLRVPGKNTGRQPAGLRSRPTLPTPSSVEEAIRQCITNKLQMVATYDRQRREMCPHAIGTKDGIEKALFYQFADEGGSPLGSPGSPSNWVCAPIHELTWIWTRSGPWHTAPKPTRPKGCFDHIEIEVET